MLTLKQKSTRPKSILLTLAAAVACLAAIAAPSAAAAPTPELGFEPGSHDFGLQPLYSNVQTSFQLRNEGAEEAWIESIDVVGSGAGSFWVGNSDCWSHPVEPGEACSIEVHFNPYEVTEYTAALSVGSAEVDFEAGLSGAGASPFFTSEPNPVDFGSAEVGGEGNTREIEVVNAGDWPGGLFIAVISGGAVGSYELLDENCTNRVIAPAETCAAQVRFRPISGGAKKATLSLFGESDGGSQISLTGVGAVPKPEPATASSDAGADSAPASAPAAATGTAAAAARAEARTRKARAHRRAKARRARARRARARRLRARRARVRQAERRRRAQQRRLRHRRSR